jgi:hypothetical protein
MQFRKIKIVFAKIQMQKDFKQILFIYKTRRYSQDQTIHFQKRNAKTI